jgi:hypothetical protein
MDKVQKTSFTDYIAPSSEPFRLHLISEVFSTNVKNINVSESIHTFYNYVSIWIQ